jgi:TolB-like protein
VDEASHAVFLSYASEDAEAAQWICEALRAGGIEVWFDQNELRGGDAWDQKIRRQIHECALFVPIISANTATRKEGYFRLEWDLADQRSHRIARDRAFIVPVCLDATPGAGTDVPESFHRVQWTRLPSGKTPPAFIARIAALLGATTPVSTTTDPGPALVTAPPARTPNRRAVWVTLGLAALAIVLGGGWFALRHPGLHRHAEASVAPQSQPGITEKSLAVLPFVDLSEKHDQEYFADGMAAEVLALLGKLPGVRAVGLRSSSQFKGRTDDLRTIGAKLGVSYVIDGSIRRSADRIRVTAQLIDTRDGIQRWSDVYDRSLSDVINVQDQIASSVARVLQVRVGDEFGSRVTARNTAAYDLYLRGLHGLDRQTQKDCEDAVADFQRALEIDPNFADASAGLAMAYWIMGEQDWLPARDAFEHARQAADNAIRLDPKLGVAHAALAEVRLLYDWDWAGAETEANLAMRFGAGVEGVKAAARVAATFMKWDRARQLIESGLAMDPLDPMLHMNLAYVIDLRSGRFAEAEAETKRTLDLSPEYASARYFHGVALLLQGHLDEALATMQQVKIDEAGPEGLAIVYFALGRKAESDAALQRAIAQDADTWPWGVATTLAFRHETDKAISWLERAYVQRDPGMYTIKGEPLFRSIENDSRYKAILRKMNLPE